MWEGASGIYATFPATILMLELGSRCLSTVVFERKWSPSTVDDKHVTLKEIYRIQGGAGISRTQQLRLYPCRS
ncbi:hypothetical protein LY78DRAFT_17091 [Colletotrichum sublineola]|nr:hypothetical protein LY78DRAFT_17091 [Colletotrichum sublineola]